MKKYIETYYKRLESLDRYLGTRKNKNSDPPAQMTLAELEREMQDITTKLKNMNEDTNTNKRPWIDTPAEEEIIPPKIKIWGEKVRI